LKPYISEADLIKLTGTKRVDGCPNADPTDAYHLHTFDLMGHEVCPDAMRK
jgi:hypothetical protein